MATPPRSPSLVATAFSEIDYFDFPATTIPARTPSPTHTPARTRASNRVLRSSSAFVPSSSQRPQTGSSSLHARILTRTRARSELHEPGPPPTQLEPDSETEDEDDPRFTMASPSRPSLADGNTEVQYHPIAGPSRPRRLSDLYEATHPSAMNESTSDVVEIDALPATSTTERRRKRRRVDPAPTNASRDSSPEVEMIILPGEASTSTSQAASFSQLPTSPTSHPQPKDDPHSKPHLFPARPPTPPPIPSRPEPLANFNCPICFTPPVRATLMPCGHVCCGECLFTSVKTMQRRNTYNPDATGREARGGAARCPVCRAEIGGWDGKGGGVIGLVPHVVAVV
jgi:hypothetical protein